MTSSISALGHSRPSWSRPRLVVCTENIIRVDEVRESLKLTRCLRFYALYLRINSHAISLADFITITSGFRFSVHTGRSASTKNR